MLQRLNSKREREYTENSSEKDDDDMNLFNSNNFRQHSQVLVKRFLY